MLRVMRLLSKVPQYSVILTVEVAAKINHSFFNCVMCFDFSY